MGKGGGACRSRARPIHWIVVEKLQPFTFTPLLKERIWGGERLGVLFGRRIAPGEKIGESWDLVDLPGQSSVIRTGPLGGLTLNQALRGEGRAITGWNHPPASFPLLVKLLDCRDVLSVQVHPDAAACRRLGTGTPKTECWYVIEARPGAVIYKGLKPGVTRKRFKQAIQEARAADLLAVQEASVGECHLLPAGTPHALGPGLVIAEIQTPSDTTYRVFDWNRVGADGRRRPLHVREALESINFQATGEKLPVTAAGRVVAADEFTVDKQVLHAGEQIKMTPGRMRVLVCVAGNGAFTDAMVRLPFTAGDTYCVPAIWEGELQVGQETVLLSVTVPDQA